MHCLQKFFIITLKLIFMLVSSGSSANSTFDMSPIVRDSEQCESLANDDKMRRQVILKLRRYCSAQNEILRANGLPFCNANECFSQVRLGKKKERPVELSLTNLPMRSNLFLKFKIYFNSKMSDYSITCNQVGMAGPFGLEQLEQLQAYMNYLIKIKNCRNLDK